MSEFEFNNFDITDPNYINSDGQFRPPTKEVLLMAIRWYKDNHSHNDPGSNSDSDEPDEYASDEEEEFPIGTWDVSQITDMSNLFSEWNDFNRDISNWNVSNVTNMESMFKGCTDFNQPLSEWGPYLSNVTDMSYMFSGCTKFDQPLNDWGPYLSNVTDMSYMFDGCTNFNQPLTEWNLRHFKRDHITGMFENSGMDSINLPRLPQPPPPRNINQGQTNMSPKNIVLNIGRSMGPEDTCPICTLNFNINPETEIETPAPDVCILNKCHHWFHCSCLNKWITTNPTCPSCRQRVIGSITGGKHTRKQRQGIKRTKQRQPRGGKRTRKPRRGKSRRHVVL